MEKIEKIYKKAGDKYDRIPILRDAILIKMIEVYNEKDLKTIKL